MPLTTELATIIRAVDHPGDFYVSGRAELLAPRIEVEGVGLLALPLLPAQAKSLIKAASRAPFGRGSETVVDTTVRRTWQIGAEQVSLGGKHWQKTLDGIVQLVANGLGVADPVKAELYKLLIYDKGSFFVGHRDTEKEPGMFATLVLALPSQSAGGELVVRHQGREARLDLANDDPSEVAFAAFYADCVHEVLPVTQGSRATLVFNLVRATKGKAPTPPNFGAEAEQVNGLLRHWVAIATAPLSGPIVDDAPTKIVIPLEHAYTPAELSFASLKGADAAIARVLTAAAPSAGVDLHLARLDIWESGSAEYTGRHNWHYRRGRSSTGVKENPVEFEVGEIFDSGRMLSDWRRPGGEATALGKIPLEDEEICPADALKDMKPDEEHFHEATGNEGASFERSYARAALVLWPSSDRLAVLTQAGTKATLPYLEQLAQRWIDDGAKPTSPLKAEMSELFGHILVSWSPSTRHSRELRWSLNDIFEDPRFRNVEEDDDSDDDTIEAPDPSDWARLLAATTSFRDVERAGSAIALGLIEKSHEKRENAAILKALSIMTLPQAADTLRQIVVAHAHESPGACGALLAQALELIFAKSPKLLVGAATALLDALPGDPVKLPKDQWGRAQVARADATLVIDLVSVVDRAANALAKRTADHVSSWPKHFDLDAVVVPAAKRMMADKTSAGLARARIHTASVTHLETRIALPLEAPRDWARESEMGCACQYCRPLRAFLADPAQPTWALRAAEQHRKHVEEQIRRARADLKTRTERTGSPHTLVCTKTQASYEQRVRQRKQDVADLAVLMAAPARPGRAKRKAK